jgi:hypothetical protein
VSPGPDGADGPVIVTVLRYGLSCSEITLHQRGGQPEDAGHVVEPVARVIGRKERRDIDVDGQQVADRVAILRAVPAMERLGASGIRPRDRGAIQLGFEPAREAVRRSPIRAGRSGRRHQAGANLANNLLPDVGGDVRESEALEHETAGLETLAVAGDAVPVQECAPRGIGDDVRLLAGASNRANVRDESRER